MQRRALPDGWDAGITAFPADAKGLASRDSSGQVLNAIAERVPWLLGGAADLAPSTKTRLTFDGAGDFGPADRTGRNLHFGVREFASAAIANGLALSKLRPFWSGFLIFSDYARGAIRLSALMEIPVIHVFTHDSIGVGEDGPTHQPVEQLASLRAMPGLLVFRPADANEVAETWRYVMQLRHEPAVLVLSRQALPTVDRSVGSACIGCRQRCVCPRRRGREPDVILIATGSEVTLALEARDELAADGIGARVVSMPCSELFDRQPAGVPRRRAPSRDHGARRGRAGLCSRLAQVRRRRWRDRGDEHLRRVGSPEGARREVRLHAGRRDRRRAEACCDDRGPASRTTRVGSPRAPLRRGP